MVDLHFHSNRSDGLLNPSEVVELVARAGVVLAALTDHDTVRGVKEAKTAAEKFGLMLLSGVEISTMYEGGEVHILGYDFDLESEEFSNFLEERFHSRTRKVEKIVEKLNALGYGVNFNDVLVQSPGPFVGRLNVAKALVKKGYIHDVKEAFSEELIGDRGAAYVAPEGLAVKKAVEMIHKAGGVAVLAHPGIYKSPEKHGLDEEDILKMVRWGLDGVEAYHSKHSHATCKYYDRLARIHGLIVTVGSDYHHGIYPLEFIDVPRDVILETTMFFQKRIAKKGQDLVK